MSEKHSHRLNILLFYGFVLFLGYLAFLIVQPFLMTLVWGAILALSSSPIYNRLVRRGWKPGKAAMVATLTTMFLLVIPALLLLVALGREVGQAFTALQAAAEDARNHQKLWNILEWIQAHVPLPNLEEIKPRLASGAETATKFLASSIGSILQNIAMLIFHLFIALVAMFFLLRDSRQFSAFVRRLLPFDDARNNQLIRKTHDLVMAGTLVTLAIAALQGLAGGVLFALLGLSAPVLWGAVMGVFALVPLIGTATIWGPAAIWLIATGDLVRGIILIVFGIAIVGGIDNVLRPALLSGKSAMNGLVALLSIMGGVAAFGFIGIVLGPVIAAAVIILLTLAASES